MAPPPGFAPQPMHQPMPHHMLAIPRPVPPGLTFDATDIFIAVCDEEKDPVVAVRGADLPRVERLVGDVFDRLAFE